MAYPHLCRCLALLLLLAPACTVLGDEEPDLDEIEAVRPIEIDLGAVRPSNCGFDEAVSIDVTNDSSRDITTWALFSSVLRKGDQVHPTSVETSAVVRLPPGETQTFATLAGIEEGEFLRDIVSARVLASNMDPSDPEPPAVAVSWTDHCESGADRWLKALPVALDPAGMTNSRQALADITPDNCLLAELSGAVVENRTSDYLSAWAAWAVEPATIGEWTIFTPPVEIAPGDQFKFELWGAPGDLTEIAVLTNQPVRPFDDLGIAWLETCADPSGQ